MKNWIAIGIAAALTIACTSKHTTGAGDPSLGVVSITGPSSVGATSGALTVGEAGVLIGAPFIGPTIPDAVPPGTPGILTVTFTSEDTEHVKVNLKFRAGVYDFDFTTSNITGSLADAVIDYDGGHAGDYGSCIKWTSSHVIFTQGIDVDRLDGNWMGDCHHSDLARAGDRGVFHLTRKGTLVVVPPVVPPVEPKKLDWCHYDSGKNVENQLNITQQAIDGGHSGHQFDYAGTCDGRSIQHTPPSPPGNGGGNGGGNGNGKP